MPATKFICPSDSEHKEVPIKQCLNACPNKVRCYSLPILNAVANNERLFKRVSGSMSGDSPRIIMLKATQDYSIDPEKAIASLIGSCLHYLYAINAGEEDIAERTIKGNIGSIEMESTADLLSPDGQGKWVLTDYKNVGSFHLAKYLGYKVKREVVYKNGKPYKYKSGYRKGQIKSVNKTYQDNRYVDVINETIQLNCYRILHEQEGREISRMEIQAIARDGNTSVSRQRGITRMGYLVPVIRLADRKVINFYEKLQAEADEAIRIGYAIKCSERNMWGGNRCDNYCPVRKQCDAMGK